MPDVVIVGAGPVGMLLAVLLERESVDVVALEQRTEISQRPRAVGLHPPAVEILRRAGVELSGSLPITRGEARDRDRVLAGMRFDPPVLTLAQHGVQHRLEQLARPPLRGTRVLGIDQDDAGVRIRMSGGSIGARLVVAADGVASGIRSQLGIGWAQRRGRARYLMADVPDDGDLDTLAVLWFGAYGVVESFPLPGRRRRWVARSPERDDLEQLVAERTGITTAIAREETSAFLAQQHIAEHWVAGRVVLLGDAAHELSPIGGQGMNLGLMDAAALAPRLVAALRGDADELVRWEGERRPAALRAMNQAAFNMAVGVPLPLLVQPLRRAAIRALSVPPVRRRLADAFTMQRL